MEHVSSGELQRALLRAIEEVAPLGSKRSVSADVYADALVALFLAASPQPEAPDELERLTELFCNKLVVAMSKRDVLGHA